MPQYFIQKFSACVSYVFRMNGLLLCARFFITLFVTLKLRVFSKREFADHCQSAVWFIPVLISNHDGRPISKILYVIDVR
jgi:hypothetical protein